MLTGRRNACGPVNRLHCGLALPQRKLIRHDPCRNVEIFSEPCVQLQPVLIVGFDPVDASVFESKESNGAVDLAIVFHGIDLIILGKRSFEHVAERIIGSVPYAQDPDSVRVEPVAKIAEVIRKIR